MFCPTCGRDNSNERKFCASCGTNLEAVSQALTGSRDVFFTKIDSALDQFIARYSERVFKDAPSAAHDQKISKSWKVLGQGVLTSFVDVLLFSLMWNIFPLRFLMLLISTPVRLLSERGKQKALSEAESKKPLDLSAPAPQKWLPESFVSVTEHTTVFLAEPNSPKQDRELKTMPPK